MDARIFLSSSVKAIDYAQRLPELLLVEPIVRGPEVLFADYCCPRVDRQATVLGRLQREFDGFYESFAKAIMVLNTASSTVWV